MNKELENKCKELNTLLKQDPSVKEYQALKNQLEESKYIELENKIKDLQKRIVNEVDRGNDVTELKKELEQLHRDYFENPLVVNYEYVMEQVNSLFQYVNDYINGAIKLGQ